MNTKQTKILDVVLSEVVTLGWTEEAFDRASKALGLSKSEARKFFSKGIDDVVAAYHASLNGAVLARIKNKRNFASMRVRDKITFAVRARFESLEKNREAMQRLLVWSVMPQHLKAATRFLWQAADSIWSAVGDTSTDYNFYTKRALLIAVMKSTYVFWLNDKSKSHVETWAFLDRRIADVMVVGKGLNVIKTVGVSDILSFVRSRFAA